MYTKARLKGTMLAATLATLAFGAQRCGRGPAPKPGPGGPTINEFAIPTATGEPVGITKGPDGNLWFTEMAGNQIGRSTVTGTMAEFPLPNAGSGPSGIALGPDGNLWFDEMDGDRIGTITPAGIINEVNLASSPVRTPADIALGPDGFMWFTEGDTSGDQIGRITDPDGNLTEAPTKTAAAMPAGIVRAFDGNLYFVETEANNIAQITPQGLVTEFPIPTANAGATAITTDAAGNLWFTEGKTGKIGKMTTAGMFTEYSTPTAGSVPAGIVLGPDCNLWFTEANGNQIGNITTAGVFAEFPLANPNSDPLGITVGPDNNIWFTEATVAATNPGKIGRLVVNPSTFNATCDANNLPPVALCQNVTVNTDLNLCTTATASVDNGSSDPQGASALVSKVQAPSGPYNLGANPVTLTLTDKSSLVAACDGRVTVQDKQAPTLSCGAPMVECTSPAGAAVTLNPVASDNCPGTLTPACTPSAGVFPLGSTTFKCSVSDASANTGSCSSAVIVHDTTPPMIGSVAANPSVLSPPNRRMVPVAIGVTDSDTCDPAPVCKITGVTANEPLGNGDVMITGPLLVSLAATHVGSGSGRLYSITVRCTDASGNISGPSTTTVTVPNCYFDFDANCAACCKIFPKDPRCKLPVGGKTSCQS